MIVPKIWYASYVTAQENCAGPGEGKGGGVFIIQILLTLF